ncbi:MAG TPA: hypothetical protein VGI78_10755 [Acetobacteraceae bacterium]
MANKPKSETVIKGPRAAKMMEQMERDAKKPPPTRKPAATRGK